ncbi:sideroflexin-4 [Anguilla rostrata]|uniref:sideroflexin-4 n=1 Tax=Anguilla rostrata TaxID=7938 RepID=UPI0030CC6D9A
MDINLQFWKSEGQSFLRRLRLWINILDPVSLLSSDGEIKKARSLLGSADPKNKREANDAWKLSLSSVHSDTGTIHPTIFRPPAFLPVAAPLVIASLLPHKGVRPAFLWQFLLQSYSAGFNFSNRNATATKDNKTTLKQALLIVGSVTYATCAGTIPQFVMTRYGLRSTSVQVFCRSMLPVPLAALLAAFNVLVVRAEEIENGVRVFDSSGNSVGISQKAGSKAVNETALSRAAMMGTTVPALVLGGSALLLRHSLLVAPVRHISAALVLGLMVPLSFSLFPQLCTIQRDDLENELQTATTDKQLFYHRGL